MAKENSARIGFIGAGKHATESLYPNIPFIPEIDLIAVCDLSEKLAARNARQFGALGSFSDVEIMLDECELDGVCIVGPPQMHVDIATFCLKRGLPVFIEKPPAPDVASAAKLVETSSKNSTWGMVGFMKRFAPSNMLALEYMNSGNMGTLSTITLMHGCGPHDSLNIMLAVNGIHFIDFARYFAGDIEKLSAIGSSFGDRRHAVSVSCKFSSGVVGTMNLNSCQNWSDCFEEVYATGTGGGMVLDESKSVRVSNTDFKFTEGKGLKLQRWSSSYDVSGNMSGWFAGAHYTRGYWGELAHFAKACLGQIEPVSTLEDGLAAMKIIEAIETSAKEDGRQIAL